MPNNTVLATNNCLNGRGSTQHSEQSYPAHTVMHLCLFVRIVFHSCQSTIGRDLNTVPRGRGEDNAHEMLFEAVASRNNYDSMVATDSITKHPLKVDCYCSLLILISFDT